MSENQKTNAVPFVKWAGGKRGIISQMVEFFPEKYNTYFEPFLGGGAVFFTLNPQKAYLNDINTTLMTTYSYIKYDVKNFLFSLKEIEKKYNCLPSLDNKKDFYLQKREMFNNTDSDFNKATLFVFLNKTCFNGLYRENSKGKFNVPFGQKKKLTICDEQNLFAVSQKLQNAHLDNKPYETMTYHQAGENDFVYFDPPYHPVTKTSGFTSYNSDGFGIEDQEKLRDEFKSLSEKGCKVMLSNSDTPLINDLYSDFNIHKIYASRSINSKGDSRGKVSEVLVTNY